MIAAACSWFQVLTVLRVGKEESRTDEETDVMSLIVRPPLAFPRDVNVSAETVLMLEARAADTYEIKYTQKKMHHFQQSE